VLLFILVGCDGTNVNVGQKNGIICRLEKYIDHAVHWTVCLLHLNELPLRHYFQYLDGKTTGPKSSFGPIGKQLPHCHDLPIVEFDPVESELPILPTDVLKDLSTDQEYLYTIALAISNGKFTDGLANRKPGGISHARWLTSASRILRLYAATLNPSMSLQKLTTFIMKVYVPVWFKIRKHPDLNNGTNHFVWLWNACVTVLDEEDQKVVMPVLSRNSYFAHSEQFLLAFLMHEDVQIRLKGIKYAMSV
jgi:hypothetical protein